MLYNKTHFTSNKSSYKNFIKSSYKRTAKSFPEVLASKTFKIFTCNTFSLMMGEDSENLSV